MKGDKELANKVVALGVGGLLDDGFTYHLIADDGAWCFQPATVFVRDWRVAGALMERVAQIETSPAIAIEDDRVEINDFYSDMFADVENESLPRAIIEACVEALT